MEKVKSILQKCITMLEDGHNVVTVTVIDVKGNSPAKPGQKMLVSESGSIAGTVGGGALEHQAIEEAKNILLSKKNRIIEYNLADLQMKCGGQASLFFEFLSGVTSFVIFGGGHVAGALAPLLESASFQVVIFDDRPEILENHKQAQRVTILGNYEDISPVLPYLKSGFSFITTQGHAHDASVLKQVLESAEEFTYLGMIGSKNKVRASYKMLEESGIEIPDFLYTPAGIDIGGDSPHEIAVSITAEILSVVYGKEVPHMRLPPD